MGLFSRRLAAKMFSSTSRRSSEPASAASMRGKSSNTKKLPTRAKRRRKTSRFSADLARHPPADDRGLDAAVSVEALPSAVAPLAQERNDVGADVILTKQLQRLVRRWSSVVSIGVDTLLPGRHRLRLASCGPIQ